MEIMGGDERAERVDWPSIKIVPRHTLMDPPKCCKDHVAHNGSDMAKSAPCKRYASKKTFSACSTSTIILPIAFSYRQLEAMPLRKRTIFAMTASMALLES